MIIKCLKLGYRAAFLYLFLLNMACSSDDAPRSPDGTLPPPVEANLTVTASNLTPEVDEFVQINIMSDAPVSQYNFTIDTNFFDNEGMGTSTFEDDGAFSATAVVKFFKPEDGVTLTIRSLDVTGQQSGEETITFDVQRGQAVKITSLTLTDFEGINETFDPEYAEDDDRRLADIGFFIYRNRFNAFAPDVEPDTGRWYVSDVMRNESSLTWDLSDQELWLDPEAEDLAIHFYDDEGFENEETGQQALFNVVTAQTQNTFSISQFIETEPEEVNITFPDGEQLTFTLGLDWPE